MIEFYNIRTKERVKLDDPHLIAAYINSSDMHVNSGQGQDFGWRVGPQDKARIDALKNDPSKLEEIARHLGKPASDIRSVDFVKYVSYLDDMQQRVKSAREEDEAKYQEDYDAEYKKALEAQQSGGKKQSAKKPATEE